MDPEAARRAVAARKAGTEAANKKKDLLRAPAKREGYARRVYRTPSDLRIWSADLLDMSQAAGTLAGYALVAVDMLTRQQRWELMGSKSAADIEKALEACFERAGAKPQKIHSDRESGIIHSRLIRELGIEVYHTNGGSAWLAEGAIKEYRRRLPSGTSWKAPIRDGTYESKYNSTNKMASLGKKTPDELAAMPIADVQALHGKREEKRDEEAPERPLLAIGTPVLRVRDRALFEKKTGAANWEPQLYEVIGVDQRVRPAMYMIRRRVVGGHLEPHRYYRDQLKPLTAGQEKVMGG